MNDRVEVLKILIQQQGRASEVIPDVIIALKDKDSGVRHLSATALQWSGEAGLVTIPALTQNLTDPEPIVRYASSSAIAYLQNENLMIDVNPIDFRKSLLLLNQPNSNLKSDVLLTIANMEQPSQDAVLYLIPLLKDKSSDIRLQTIDALINIGDASIIAIPYLIPLLKDPDQAIQQRTRATLEILGAAN